MDLSTAVDSLYLYDPQFEAGAKRFLSEVGGSSAACPITSYEDLKKAVSSYVLVKFLVFDTHGKPGAIYLPSGTYIEGIDFMMIGVPSSFLSQNARLLFYGCNLGEGSEGDKFLDEIGQYLLRGKGGIVGATTSTNMTFSIGSFSSEVYMTPLSFGRLKVRRYNVMGVQDGANTVDRHGIAR